MRIMYTHLNPPPQYKNPGGGEKLVETLGYVDANKQIQAMIFAGERLDASRNDFEFDFEDDESIDDTLVDETRDPNYDMADAFQSKQRIKHDMWEKSRENLEKTAKKTKEEYKVPDVVEVSL
nr:MAG: hypothetical protein [Microviridae sp.]